MNTRLLGLLAGALLVGVGIGPPCAAAEGYPSRPIRLVVAGAPGSPPDALARVIGEPLAAWGQPVVVDDRPGGGGALALGTVVRASADGHTLGIVGLPQVVLPALMPGRMHDGMRELVPVTPLVWTANVIVVRTESPLRSAADLVAQAKSKPGVWAYASAGVGTPSHLAAELFKHSAGIDVRHVPFKGIPAGLVALMGEQVQFAFAGVAAALPLIQSGKLRALGTAGTARLPALPNLPTLAESGWTGVQLNEWYGVAAPAGTPPEVIAALARELARIIVRPQTRARLERLGMVPVDATGPDALAATMQADARRWHRLVRELGIRGE